MGRVMVRDKYGRRTGEIETDADGRQTAYDAGGQKMGTYDPGTNMTYDRYNERFGEGNLLVSLVGPQKHNPLLWGAGGFLLGSAAAGVQERRHGREEYETRGKNTESLEAIGGLFVCAALVLLGIFIWSVAKHHTEFPGKQIVAVYYYGLTVPLKWVLSPWQFICTQPLTDYPNLNMVLAISAIILIVILLYVIVGLVFRTFPKLASSVLALFFLGPWLFWMGWVAYKWLFARAG